MDDSIDAILNKLDLNPDNGLKKETRLPVTFWISEDHKRKYDLIQCQTKRQLGKMLTEIIKQSIDKIEQKLV